MHKKKKNKQLTLPSEDPKLKLTGSSRQLPPPPPPDLVMHMPGSAHVASSGISILLVEQEMRYRNLRQKLIIYKYAAEKHAENFNISLREKKTIGEIIFRLGKILDQLDYNEKAVLHEEKILINLITSLPNKNGFFIEIGAQIIEAIDSFHEYKKT